MSHAPALDANGLPSGYPFQSEWEIAPRELKARIEGGEDLLLIDCRTAQERELASIAGSVHVPFQDVASHLEALREHEDRPIVIHCHQGGRSLRMTALLRREGFSNVRSMAGGIHLWSIDIDPSVPTY
ncbi:MAG: rhodanese-like domain-containing protein [Phycisphaeraceae bacterium]|nr:rhodanese-like domain-containing protein [Phycisphaeraceae bacterium]